MSEILLANSAMDHQSPLDAPRKPWQKRLYGNEGYADNYTDPSFLQELQKNLHVKTFTVLEAICGASILTHQISIICAFLLVFFHLFKDIAQPSAMLLLSGAATITGYLLVYIRRQWTGCHVADGTLFDDLKTTLSALAFGFIMSPMLHTLTFSISTDTIYTVTFFVFILHLVCYDYGLPAAVVSSAISLNAVYFGSICLASRLATSMHAYALLVVAIVMFALYPRFLSTICDHRNTTTILSLAIFFVIDGIYLWLYSKSLFCVYVIGVVFINLCCPVIFCYLHKHKDNIHGPWDEAVVDVVASDLPKKIQ